MSTFKTRISVYISDLLDQDVLVQDNTLPITDVVSRHLSKVIDDQISMLDSATRAATTGVLLSSPQITLPDNAALATSKPVTPDTFGFTDAAALAFARGAIAETVPVTDAAVRSYSKVLAEAISLTDVFSWSQTQTVGDTLTLTETFEKGPNLSKGDTFGFSDSLSVLPGTQFLDASPVTDSSTRHPGKTFDELITLGDSANTQITGGSSYSDSVGITVQFSFVSTKSLTESMVLAETGLLRMQDYAAQDYFAEDYVVATTRFW
jgi:hypothetical protein